MELYQEMLAHILAHRDVHISFPDLPSDAAEQAALQVLREIVTVVRDDHLDDAACFAKIEEIVCVLEANGISGDFRHDFG